MDLTVSMKRWRALPAHLQRFVETEVHAYSDIHHAAIQAADAAAWAKFEAAGTIINRLSDEDVERFTELSVPRWFAWANKDPMAARIFKIQLDYMMSGNLGYVTRDMIRGLRLNYT
jgi:TRAP-type C4-dicarboxylate transport system substrate-binding protein